MKYKIHVVLAILMLYVIQMHYYVRRSTKDMMDYRVDEET